MAKKRTGGYSVAEVIATKGIEPPKGTPTWNFWAFRTIMSEYGFTYVVPDVRQLIAVTQVREKLAEDFQPVLHAVLRNWQHFRLYVTSEFNYPPKMVPQKPTIEFLQNVLGPAMAFRNMMEEDATHQAAQANMWAPDVKV